MEPKQPKKPYNTEDERELFDNELFVSSATDCTGLIPAAVTEESEIESYSEIYDIPLSKYNSNKENPSNNPTK